MADHDSTCLFCLLQVVPQFLFPSYLQVSLLLMYFTYRPAMVRPQLLIVPGLKPPGWHCDTDTEIAQ